jgi:hypothetical protein
MPQPLYPQGKSPWYPLDRRLGRSQSQFGCSGEEKNSQPLWELEPLIIQPIAQHYTTELSQPVPLHSNFSNIAKYNVTVIHPNDA